jgi:L-threonylcarbamoyladenylate synthase
MLSIPSAIRFHSSTSEPSLQDKMSTIRHAVALLSHGRLVAFPTETVYGLGADARNPTAVQKIFQAKGRPPTNPLIVHIAGKQSAQRFTTAWPKQADILADAFWPGPLTLVLPKTDSIVSEATAGRSTVGLRAPNHPLALELLSAFDGPIAAPSANRSNHLSPTTAAHVRQELGDAVDLILDGGPCQVGIESTVLDLSTAHPMILRPGNITREQIEQLIGPVSIFEGSIDSAIAAASPGQQERHYAPLTPAFRFDGPPPSDRRAGFVLIGTTLRHTSPTQIEMPGNPQAYARHFYAVLRKLDQLRLSAIYIQMPPDHPDWTAVRDRIRRATTPS